MATSSIPLPQLIHNWYQYRDFLAFLLAPQGKEKDYRNADMALGAMLLQARYGELFASARTLGFEGAIAQEGRWVQEGRIPEVRNTQAAREGRRRRGTDALGPVESRGEKAWDRLLIRLRRLGLVETRRRSRAPDGVGPYRSWQSTNTTDLTKLWARLVSFMRSIRTARGKWPTRIEQMIRIGRKVSLKADGFYLSITLDDQRPPYPDRSPVPRHAG